MRPPSNRPEAVSPAGKLEGIEAGPPLSLPTGPPEIGLVDSRLDKPESDDQRATVKELCVVETLLPKYATSDTASPLPLTADLVALFYKENYQVHVRLGPTKNVQRPTIAVLDTGAGPNLV